MKEFPRTNTNFWKLRLAIHRLGVIVMNRLQYLLTFSLAAILVVQKASGQSSHTPMFPGAKPASYEGIEIRRIKPPGLRLFRKTNVEVLEYLEDASYQSIKAPSLEAVSERFQYFNRDQGYRDLLLHRYEMADQLRKLSGDRLTISKYLRSDGKELDYLLILPEKYDKSQSYPLVLCLHGSGGWRTDLHTLAALPGHALLSQSEKNPCIILVPQADENEMWGYASSHRKGRKQPEWRSGWSSIGDEVVGLIKDIGERHAVDDKRIYVVGGSMGGQGTMGMVTEHPGIFAGAVASVAIPLGVDAPKLDCPLWLFTAEFEGLVEDTSSVNYLPQKLTHNFEFYKRARTEGKNVRLTMFCSHGHHVGCLVFYYPGIWDWLFALERGGIAD
ncbi:MAG: alpha/beta hydrolase-fold protein [Verrucomicrobiota bacterium]